MFAGKLSNLRIRFVNWYKPGRFCYSNRLRKILLTSSLVSAAKCNEISLKSIWIVMMISADQLRVCFKRFDVFLKRCLPRALLMVLGVMHNYFLYVNCQSSRYSYPYFIRAIGLFALIKPVGIRNVIKRN